MDREQRRPEPRQRVTIRVPQEAVEESDPQHPKKNREQRPSGLEIASRPQANQPDRQRVEGVVVVLQRREPVSVRHRLRDVDEEGAIIEDHGGPGPSHDANPRGHGEQRQQRQASRR